MDFIVDVDKDKMQRNIETFSKVFNEAVSKAVEAKLASKTPTDYGDSGKCVLCGSTENLHFDHDLPFSKGGTSLSVDNIQILYQKCNLKKSDKIE